MPEHGASLDFENHNALAIAEPLCDRSVERGVYLFERAAGCPRNATVLIHTDQFIFSERHLYLETSAYDTLDATRSLPTDAIAGRNESRHAWSRINTPDFAVNLLRERYPQFCIAAVRTSLRPLFTNFPSEASRQRLFA